MQVRLLSLRKEATLTFLAAFYFLIATNTQTGWLFLMSAFMLGVLGISWVAPRAALGRLKLERNLLQPPQRGVPFSVQLRLKNAGGGLVREVRIEQPALPWATEGQFRWAVPRLVGAAQTEFHLTPTLRGEHRLEGTRLICGAPFGLFTVYRELEPDEPFLVYPKLETLPTRSRRSRLAGVLTEVSAPHKKGDSRTLRALREYQPGDDLRLVHWKSSARRTDASLMLREHQAPSHQVSLVVLANHQRGQGDTPDVAFEKAVSLVASVLWSAHRAGTRTCLAHQGPQGEWKFLKRWQEQYVALARIQPEPGLDFATWLTSARTAMEGNPLARLSAPVLFAALEAEDIAEQGCPDWVDAAVVSLTPDLAQRFRSHPRLVGVNALEPGFREVPLG